MMSLSYHVAMADNKKNRRPSSAVRLSIERSEYASPDHVFLRQISPSPEKAKPTKTRV